MPTTAGTRQARPQSATVQSYTCCNVSYMVVEAGHERVRVGMRELSQRTARVLELVRAGWTVEVTDRGKTVARIVPATDDRYAQLVAAGVIRPARRPFDLAHLPEPEANRTGRTSDEWLAELREG
ncbi:MAG TPA: type II toxin-antitoxin system prevent-host-death family antitoxin [Frankiaceae bacterium]|nr:type II toxin-antitoxin system prevent-host-death family antitoxin [Frankiaceae bacterium]